MDACAACKQPCEGTPLAIIYVVLGLSAKKYAPGQAYSAFTEGRSLDGPRCFENRCDDTALAPCAHTRGISFKGNWMWWIASCSLLPWCTGCVDSTCPSYVALYPIPD